MGGDEKVPEALIQSPILIAILGALGGVFLSVFTNRLLKIFDRNDSVPNIQKDVSSINKDISQIKHDIRDIHKISSEVAVIQRDVKTLFYRIDEARRAHFELQKEVIAKGP